MDRGTTPTQQSFSAPLRVAVLSVVKHDYVARGISSHPAFQLTVVADDPGVPDWIHERNQEFADRMRIPYLRDVERALRDFRIDVAVVSSEAERHCDLSIRACELGVHVVQDKPMSTRLSECERLVESVQRNRVKFLLWNRNRLPALMQAEQWVRDGEIGEILSAHVDFYFSKDAGPPLGSRRTGDPPVDWLEFQRAAHADGSDGAVGTVPIGEMRNEAIYPLAYIRQLTAARFERVYARSAIAFHQVNADNHVEDVGTISLELNGGRLATVAIGRIGAASHPDLGEIKISLIGTQGALVIAEARPEIAVYYRGQPAKEFRRRRLTLENDFLLADSFAKSIADDAPTLLDERAAYEITATVEAALRSASSNQFEPVVELRGTGNRE